MPALRSDSALIAFRRKLEACGYDLRAWRAQQVQGQPPSSHWDCLAAPHMESQLQSGMCCMKVSRT
jgi:hypothetical protein